MGRPIKFQLKDALADIGVKAVEMTRLAEREQYSAALKRVEVIMGLCELAMTIKTRMEEEFDGVD